MNMFRTSLLTAALVLGLASAGQADVVRKVDSFDLAADQSGSMMMKIEGSKMTKAAAAKQVFGSIVEVLPNLGYQGSLQEWLASLAGAAGQNGANGKSAYELAVENGYVTVDRKMNTNLAGLFAAGDCTGGPLQGSKAVGEGLIAGQSAAAYVAELLRKQK